MKAIKRIASIFMFMAFAIGGAAELAKASWTTGDGNGNDNANPVSETFTSSAQEPICYNASTNVKYPTIYGALNAATSGQTIYVYPSLHQNSTVVSGSPTLTTYVTETNNLVIKNGVTLALPFTGTSVSEMNTSTMHSFSNKSRIDTSLANVHKNRKICLNMREGADITIQSGGTLTIGGKFYQNGVCLEYCEINLGSGSSIACNGTLNCYGVIKEQKDDTNTTFNTTTFGNTNDSGRSVILYSGSSLKTYACLKDAKSGATILSYKNAGICPFNTYDFAGIQTFMSVKYGATVTAYVVMFISSESFCQSFTVISNGSSNSMFILSSGASIDVEYVPKDVDYFTGATNTITKISINGTVEIGRISITVDGQTVDTNDFFLPIGYNIKIAVFGTLTTSKRVKFLPGSEMHIRSGGTFTFSNKITFYRVDRLPSTWSYGNKTNDALLECNGSLVAGSSSGAIGARITHSSTQGNASVNLSSITSQSNLTVTTNEEINGADISVTSIGLFNIGGEYASAQFKSGQTYTSGYASNNYYWNGEYIDSSDITFTIGQTSFTRKLISYSVYQNTSQSTSGQEAIAEDVTEARSYPFKTSNYIHITTKYGCTFTATDSSGNPLTITNGWIRHSGDIIVTIMPVEAVNLTISTESKSGAGSITYTIKLGSTSSVNESTFDTSSANQTITMPKGYYIRVKMNGMTYSSVTIKSGSENLPDGFSHDTAVRVNGDAAVHFNFSTCVTSDTLITMANGTKKMIKDVKSGELVMTYDFFSGKYIAAPVGAVVNHGMSTNTIMTAFFDDGSKLEMVNEHGLYDYIEKQLIAFNGENNQEYVGHKFISETNGNISYKTLVNITVEEKECEAWSIFTVGTLNAVTNDILSTNSALPIARLVTDLDNEFKYDQTKLTTIIEKYGYASYEEWAEYLDEQTYAAFNFDLVNLYIGQGITDKEEIVWWINFFYELAEAGLVQ